jgi:hypothetical protein
VPLPDFAAGIERHGIGQAWHCDSEASQSFRLYWQWRSRAGQPEQHGLGTDIGALGRPMSIANHLRGVLRIQGELLKLGFAMSLATVVRYMP